MLQLQLSIHYSDAWIAKSFAPHFLLPSPIVGRTVVKIYGTDCELSSSVFKQAFVLISLLKLQVVSIMLAYALSSGQQKLLEHTRSALPA